MVAATERKRNRLLGADPKVFSRSREADDEATARARLRGEVDAAAVSFDDAFGER